MGDMREFLKQRKARMPEPKDVNPDAVLTRACGHKVAIRHLTGSKCPGCVAKDRTTKAVAKVARNLQRREKGRLPGGARYQVGYNADLLEWRGTLFIPVGEGQEKTFVGNASGVFVLLEQLDGMYRAWFAEQSTSANPAASHGPASG